MTMSLFTICALTKLQYFVLNFGVLWFIFSEFIWMNAWKNLTTMENKKIGMKSWKINISVFFCDRIECEKYCAVNRTNKVKQVYFRVENKIMLLFIISQSIFLIQRRRVIWIEQTEPFDCHTDFNVSNHRKYCQFERRVRK